jgi:hypothetical protein
MLSDLQLYYLTGGPPSTFLSVDGVHSWIYSFGTYQGVQRRHFLALMVGAPLSTALAPSRGAVIDVS